MPILSEKYKHAGHSLSLTLPVNFLKLNTLEMVIEAYNYLLLKGRRKTTFIMDAIDYYDSLPPRNPHIAAFNDRRRIAQEAKETYSLETKADIKKLLAVSPKTKKYATICSLAPDYEVPKKMLCGFRIGDPRAEDMHKRLCSLQVQDRIMLISKAVVAYVLDGNDEDLETVNIHRFVKDYITEYRNTKDKNTVIENMALMMGITE